MKKLVFGTLCALLVLAGCGSEEKDDKTLVVGATTAPHAQILKYVQKDLEKEGVHLEIKEFSDYTKINTALNEGSLDANYFQHQVYLDGYNEDSGADLISVGAIHYEPLGMYADDPAGKTSISLDDVKEGDQIAVPNDATNEARALLLLEKFGIIKLKAGAGILATKLDIVENPKNVEIVEIEASQLPRQLPSVKYAVINGNYALDAGVIEKVIVTEDKEDEAAITYANIIAVRKEDKDNEKIKKLVNVLKSEKTQNYINETFNGTVVPSK